MARVRLCVCGSWFVGREGQAAHPRAPGQCLHFECRGAPARVRVWRCEGRPPLPHHFVCVETFTLPYLMYLIPGPVCGERTLTTAQKLSERTNRARIISICPLHNIVGV